MSQQTVRLDSLTGIRAVAIALVFWHHAAPIYDMPSAGMVGVSLFYLLSGFVMAWTDRPGDTTFAFYRRRFARIIPTYVVVVVAVLLWLISRGQFEITDLWALTLLQSWIPDPAVYFAGSAVFWSLSVEVFFYVVFPAVRLATRRLSQRGLWVLAAGCVMVSAMISVAGWVAPFGPQTQWLVTVFPPSRLPEFVLGAAIGTLVARGWRAPIPVLPAVALSAFAVIVAMYSPYALSRYAINLVPFAVLIVALANADLRPVTTFANLRPVVKVGIWSYAFYLVHAVILEQFMEWSRTYDVGRSTAVASSFLASIAVAWALHVLVERPSERVLRPRGRARLDSDATARL